MSTYSGSGGKSKKQKQPTRTPDNLFSEDLAELVLSFGEGPIHGLVDGLQSVNIGDTPFALTVDGQTEYNFQDIALDFRQGYEDDQPIEFLMGGETSNINSQSVELIYSIPRAYTTPSPLRGQVRFLNLRLLVSALYKGDTAGNVYEDFIVLKVEYKPSNEQAWRTVSTSTTQSIKNGWFQDTVIRYVTDLGLNWETLTPGQQEYYRAEAEKIALGQESSDPNLWTQTTRGKAQVTSAQLSSFNRWVRIVETSDVSTTEDLGSLYVIRGKTQAGYIHELNIPVPPNENDWDIRVTKQTKELTPTEATTSQRTIGIESISALGPNRRQYPRVAVMHLIAQYTDRFSAISDCSLEVYGLLCDVPTNYNPFTNTYSGPWLGGYKKAWTNNNAWILRELIMNPDWGDRSREANIQIDPASFYEAAQYCDYMLKDINDANKSIPRHTFNMVLQEYQSSADFKDFVAGSFRAKLSEKNGVYYLHIDKARQPLFFVSEKTITPDGFTYMTTDLSTRFNRVTVAYENQDTDYAEDRRTVVHKASVNKYGIIQYDFQAVGVTNISEAVRAAAFALYTNTNETILVNFKIPRVGLYLSPYDNFLVCDSAPNWGYSERVKSYDPDTGLLTVRDPLVIPINENFDFTMHGKSGLVYANATKVDEYTLHITGASNFTDLIAFLKPDTVFILENETIGYAKQFRLVSLSDEANGQAIIYTVEATIVDRTKYEKIDNLTNTSTELDYSTSVQINTKKYVTTPRDIRVWVKDFSSVQGQPVYHIEFTEVPNAVRYEVVWYLSNNDQVRRNAVIYTNVADIAPAYDYQTELVTFEVTAYLADGTASSSGLLINQQPPLYSGSFIGPANVAGNYANNQITFTWPVVGNPDDYNHLLAYIETPSEVLNPFRLNVTDTTVTIPYAGAGVYYVRLAYNLKSNSAYYDSTPKFSWVGEAIVQTIAAPVLINKIFDYSDPDTPEGTTHPKLKIQISDYTSNPAHGGSNLNAIRLMTTAGAVLQITSTVVSTSTGGATIFEVETIADDFFIVIADGLKMKLVSRDGTIESTMVPITITPP